jgi:hypothetical protein
VLGVAPAPDEPPTAAAETAEFEREVLAWIARASELGAWVA